MAWFNFIQNHKRNLALASTGYSPYFVTDHGRVITSQTIQPSTALTNSDIYAIVSRISSNIAGMNFKSDNPLVTKAIEKPSKLINGFSFWQKVVIQMLLTGNAYVLIERDGNQQPRHFIQVPANNVQINLLSKKAGDKVDDAVYTVTLDEDNGERFSVPSSEILHFRCTVTGFDSQTNGYCGISPLVSLAQEAAIQDNSNKLASAALSHAIAPSYVVKIPKNQIEDALKENFRSAIEKMTTGENTGRAMVLDSSMDIQPLQVNPNVDSLLSNTQFSQKQIAKAFGIPSEYLNGEGDQQSSIQMMSSLYVNGLAPYVKSLLSEMSLKLGADVRADFSSLADVDHQQLISNIVSLSSGKTAVLPARVALHLLKNVDALGLSDIPDDEIEKGLSEMSSTGSPPTKPLKGGVNNENTNNEQ